MNLDDENQTEEVAPEETPAPDAADTAAEEPAAEPAPEAADAPEPVEEAAPKEPEERRPEKPANLKAPPENTFNVSGVRRRPPTPQELDNEDALFAQDLQRGHLKPETMADLFAKKDTLGKVGTIFGLLLGGMGSGLTGQPNALVEMMKNEINNDFEAQKLSNTNAQNWLRLSQQHELQKAQLEQMSVENKYKRAMTEKIPSEIEQTKAATKLSEAQGKKIPSEIALNEANAQTLYTTNALNKMTLAAIQSIQNDLEKMPDGPSKQQGIQTFTNVVKPGLEASIADNNKKAAGQVAARNALTGAQEPPPIDMKRFSALQRLGQLKPGFGGMDGSDVANATKEAEAVIDNRVATKIWADSFNKLDKAFLAGTLNPQLRDAEIATLGAEVARETAGRFNAQEAASQANAMFPSPKDWGHARDEKFRKGVQFFEGREAATPTLDRFKLKSPFPYAVREKDEKKKESVASAGKKHAPVQSGPKEGAVQTGKSGRQQIYKGGKWIYK